MEKLAPFFPGCAPAWTGNAMLPGSDLPAGGVDALAVEFERKHPFLDSTAARRLARSYGTEARKFLGNARRSENLGRDFGCGFSTCELQ